MPDCSWCNEHNCPMTVEKYKPWFSFAKSRETLTKEVIKRNEKCVRVCTECAKIANEEFLGLRSKRELSKSEKIGIKEQKENMYLKLASLSGEFKDFVSESPPYERGRPYKIREKGRKVLENLKERYNQLRQREKEIIDESMSLSEPSHSLFGTEESEQIFDNLTEESKKITVEVGENLIQQEMVEGYLEGDNYLTWLICKAKESRIGLGNETGQDRINLALNTTDRKGRHVLTKTDNKYYLSEATIDDNYRRVSQEDIAQRDWDLLWDEVIVPLDRHSESSYIDPIDPEKCIPPWID